MRVLNPLRGCCFFMPVPPGGGGYFFASPKAMDERKDDPTVLRNPVQNGTRQRGRGGVGPVIVTRNQQAAISVASMKLFSEKLLPETGLGLFKQWFGLAVALVIALGKIVLSLCIFVDAEKRHIPAVLAHQSKAISFVML